MSNKYHITNFRLLYRASELEVENEKLRQDYQLLRNSIDRGVESRELEGKNSNYIFNVLLNDRLCSFMRCVLLT